MSTENLESKIIVPLYETAAISLGTLLTILGVLIILELRRR
jgi:hypothetical protein